MKLRTLVQTLAGILAVFVLAEGSYRARLAYLNGRQPADPDEFPLYVLGESTTRGHPYASLGDFSFSTAASKMLGDSINGRPIRIRMLAEGGDSIYPQWRKIRLQMAYRKKLAGAAFIYSGINEVFLMSRPHPNLPARMFSRLENNYLSRSFILSDALFFARKYLGFYRERSLDWYEYYLGETVKICKEAGLKPFISTLVSDLSGVEPSISGKSGKRNIYNADYMEQGRRLEQENRYEAALEHYAKAAAPDALTKYRAAKCLERLGRYPAAAALFDEAMELDSHEIIPRAVPAQNRVIRKIAAGRDAQLVDCAGAFKKASVNGLSGNDLFVDFHHPNLRGYLLMAGEFARSASAVFKTPLLRPGYSVAEVLKDFSFEAGRLSRSYTDSGIALIRLTRWHPAPYDIYKFAEQDFRKAIALCPGDLYGWLGLGIAEVVQAVPLSRDKQLVDRINTAAGGRYFYITPEELADWLELFAKYKVDGAIAENVNRLKNAAGEPCRERITSAKNYGPEGL